MAGAVIRPLKVSFLHLVLGPLNYSDVSRKALGRCRIKGPFFRCVQQEGRAPPPQSCRGLANTYGGSSHKLYGSVIPQMGGRNRGSYLYVNVRAAVMACTFLMLVFQMWWKFLSTLRLKAISHYLHHKILCFLIFLALCTVQALCIIDAKQFGRIHAWELRSKSAVEI